MSSRPIRRELVDAGPVDEFGAITEQEAFEDPGTYDHDLTYTPGFSEMRKERDLQILEYKQGTRRGKDVMSLPVNVRMVRRVGLDMTTPNGQSLMKATNHGYRPITKDDIGKPWFKTLPPGAREMPDGSIINSAGDLQYVVADAPAVRRNLRRKAQAATSQVEASASRMDGLLRTAGAYAGSEPTAGKATDADLALAKKPL